MKQKKINKDYGPRTTEKYFNFQMMDNELDEPVYKQVSKDLVGVLG